MLPEQSRSCATNNNTLSGAAFPGKEGQHIPECDLEPHSLLDAPEGGLDAMMQVAACPVRLCPEQTF